MQIANLLVSCPDQNGLVAAVTKFVATHNGNLITLEQHIEDGMFFMRLEWDLSNFDLSRAEFITNFKELSSKYSMDFRLDYPERKKRLGLFCSREPHCLFDILMRQEIGELALEIPYVISNFEDCSEIVEKFNIPFYYIPAPKGSFEHEKEQLEIIQNNSTDFIGLARYMKVLSNDFIKSAGQQIINVHHSFLPSFIGAKPYDEAYERGVKMIGATSHYVTPELDQGPIIEQSIRRVTHAHQVNNLKLMGRESEKEVFAYAIKKHVENKVVIYKNRTIVFL